MAAVLSGRRVNPTYAVIGEVHSEGGMYPVADIQGHHVSSMQDAGIQVVFLPRQNAEQIEKLLGSRKVLMTTVPVENLKTSMRIILGLDPLPVGAVMHPM
jgi:ATP-dependent Lon protease